MNLFFWWDYMIELGTKIYCPNSVWYGIDPRNKEERTNELQ